MTTDLRITQGPTNAWDLRLDQIGDLDNGDFLDSSINYAILGERRASPSEVLISEQRRGWIGNEGKDFENGSKIWLFQQSRITRSVLSDIRSAALDALQYLVDDGFAIKIDAETRIVSNFLFLELNIFVSQSKVETPVFKLWQNTGST